MASATKVIGTILKHDDKVTSYKIALLRAINDVVISFPDLLSHDKDVAIPLRTLARFWLAYYWSFFDGNEMILQGPRAMRDGKLTNDMAFRGELVDFRKEWASIVGESIHPADGFLIVNDLHIPRKRNSYPNSLLREYDKTIKKISHTIQMPIRYAGHGQWMVFDRPNQYSEIRNHCVCVPGTLDRDVCLVVNAELWRGFHEMSLYVEALCIHEWSLFTERKNDATKYERGFVYRLLTERPGNRRPLTWERNQVDILLMEEKEFICPWTEKRIRRNVSYDIDHLVPISVYPINELWNLIPSDPYFNMHKKRDRLPSSKRLLIANPHLRLAYENYGTMTSTAQAIREDVRYRFSGLQSQTYSFAHILANSVVDFIDQIATARNVARF
jgi:hypothetical protein